MTNSVSSRLQVMVRASLFGALTAAGALIAVPLQPVPFTLQTFFTALSGVLLGSCAGALSQLVYVILGCIGLPVFAGGKAGPGVLLGPTGGYLIGFIAGAYIIGKIVEMRPGGGWLWLMLAILAGDVAIYGLGTLQLAIVSRFGPTQAIIAGIVPFLLPELIKLLAAASLAVRIRPGMGWKSGESHD